MGDLKRVVPIRAWLEKPTWGILRERLSALFQGADKRFPWLAYAEGILPVHFVRPLSGLIIVPHLLAPIGLITAPSLTYIYTAFFHTWLCSAWFILWSWWWRQYVSLKHQYTSTRLHDITSLNIVPITGTAAKK
jgi:hypothetical protein